MCFSSFVKMGSPPVSDSCHAESLLLVQLTTRAMGFSSVASLFGSKLIEFNSEIIESINEIPP